MTETTEDRAEGWEYLMLAHELRNAIESHEQQYNDYRVGYAQPSGERITGAEDVPGDIRERTDEASTVISNIERLFSGSTVEAAIGMPGEAGNPDLIRQWAARVADVYAAMLSWAVALRGAKVPAEARPVYDALALYVAQPLEQMRAFTTKFVVDVEAVIDDVRAGRDPRGPIVAELVVSIDPKATSSLESAMADFTKSVIGTSIQRPRGIFRRRG
jgi:hypothetical protein